MARFEKSKTKKGIRPIYIISPTEISNNNTEFKCLDSEKMCLNPILDLYNGEVISFGVSNRPTLDFIFKSLNEVLETIENEAEYGTTIHSDHGWPYKHQKWVKTLENHRVFQRMSRKATSADNTAMEKFLRNSKTRNLLRLGFTIFHELKKQIEKYMDYYNNE